MRYRLLPHPEVIRDFSNILNLIANYAGYVAGRRKIVEIKQSISSLKDYPHIGPIRDEIVPGLRAIPCAEKAVICFTVDDEARTIKIVCVSYAGQDWQTIAKARK